MTYAVAVRLQRGVVFAADTRTNAGIDNVSQFRKPHGVHWRHSPKLIRLVALHFATKQLACARHFRHLDILVTDNIDVDPDRLASLNAGIDASFLFLLQSPDHGIEFIVRNIIRVDRAHLSPLALPASAVRAALV